MRTIAALALAALIGSASNARAQVRDARPAPPATGTAVIRGRVVAGDGGRPLRRVQLRFSTSAQAPQQGRTTSTDEDGKYEITELPAGRYTVTATRAGFLPLRYGQQRPRELGKLVDVADGQAVDHIDFALPKMSVITGRVTDEEGEPIAGVNVHAMRSTYFDGRRQLLRSGESIVATDDVGEYRITGLVPGTYVIEARSRDEWTVTSNGIDQTMGYAPTYFPGTSNIDAASRVTVGVGREATADFALQPGRAVTVSGKAFDSNGTPLQSVVLSVEVRSEGGGMFSGAGNVRTAADGSFAFHDVAPGDYMLKATRQDPANPEVAVLPIFVDSVDLTNLTLTGSTGGTVTGKVALDEGVTAKMPSVRINLAERVLGQPDPTMLGTFRGRYTPVEPPADGTFTVSHVFGPALFDVTLPDGWIVKSIARDGRDITDQPIALLNGEQFGGVQITLTNQVTSLAGTVVGASGVIAPEATVVAFAADVQKWFEGSRFVRATRPDQQGRYQIKGLPPGEYLAIALPYVEDGSWNEPEYLESLRQRADKVTLSVSEPQTLALKMAALP